MVVPFTFEDQRLAESLASQAAIALTNRMLITQLEMLFESLIGLINTAIDDKSPYTGGHCKRVPALTMMLAEAAALSIDGPLAEFKMTDKDRYELKIAGLLHDCGKITTPEWVMDKATKLQSINDRIELVALRFAKRAAEREAACWQGIAEGGDRAVALALLREQVLAIDDDLTFIRKANIGGETMIAADQERIRTLGRAGWLTVDEVRNLSIARGTLLPEEREVINHHIVATLRMLEKLPFPAHLAQVPEIACGHHERMDGKGYPKGLTREQMSVPARIMGIADVFEALTAGDRPYKKAMKLSEALAILATMARDGHIDPDLHRVFVEAKVWQAYARKFLQADQLDL